MNNITDDLRISAIQPLVAPAILMNELPLPHHGAKLISNARNTVAEILAGQDKRLLVVVGPCSIHDTDAALEYAEKLMAVTGQYQAELFIVLRVYFEKPRTVIGWKGLINDPDMDGSFKINQGLRTARQLLLDVTETGLPAASEFLDTTVGQYYADLISFAAIGARTVESQVHRELASGLSMPVGFKNRTDGDMQVACDAIQSASHPHWFPSLTKEGSPAILQTAGNPHCFLILRGGNRSGPNYSTDAIDKAGKILARNNLPGSIIVDCSHGNSLKDPQRQLQVSDDIATQIANGETAIKGVMLESHLRAGKQSLNNQPLVYGQSITDGCLSFDDTLTCLDLLAKAVKTRNADR